MELDKLPIIAFVYLLSEGDERNKCLLTTDALILIRKGATFTFRMDEIKNLHYAKKLFLFPLIFGGIFGPFSFIAIINGTFHPIISLLGFLTSLFAFYIGFSGKKSFSVETINDKKEIFLTHISDNVKEFTRFVNNIVIQGEKNEESLTFFLKIDNDRKKKWIREGVLNLETNGEYLLTRKTIDKKREPDILYIPVNYTIPNIQIKFERNDQNILQPKIYGKISSNNPLISAHLK